MSERNSDNGLALYIHWPFCISKCPYCDFNSHVRGHVDQELWLRALSTELAYEAALTKGRPLSSIFFGGGTPSLMPPAIVAALIQAADAAWGFAPGIEISLEANPSSVEAAHFADLAAAGINRVSLGMQALGDDALSFLGRAHNVAEGLAALEVAQRAFGRVSIDLIYARPGQNEAQWRRELDEAVALGTGHMSLYQLTIEDGTRFASDVRKGIFKPMDEDTGADLFAVTRARMDRAQMPAYEISNHARSGEESRHNLTYWRYQDYVGIGPGAHGRRMKLGTRRHSKPENYLSAVMRNGHGMAEETPLGPAARAAEALLMGLRLREGVDLADIAARTGVAQARLIDHAAAEKIAALGMLTRNAGRLMITPKGMPLLDAILPQIVAIEADRIS